VFLTRIPRGPRVARVLQALGIDPRRYWLLMDLFAELSERREMLGQLGRQGASLKIITWLYFGLMGVVSLLIAASGPSLASYYPLFLAFSTFLLVAVLVPETSNSLVNPVEGLVLAHQPVDGATYTAAKLSHLASILLYLVPGLNLVPALAGLELAGARWYYPLLYLAAALALGIIAAAGCCALFGWLVRFVPAPRLKSAAQIVETVPWLFYVAFNYGRTFFPRLHFARWLPSTAAGWLSFATLFAIASLAALVFGVRSLSGDYLVRVSSIVHGGSGAKSKPRPSRLGDAVARVFGGPPSRGAFEYVSRMVVRDWQFRRQLIPMIPMLIAPAFLLIQYWRTSPFSHNFTAAHLVPHMFGGFLFFLCPLLPYGTDYKGAWLFLLAPNRVFAPFARGVYAFLWLKLIVIPHLVLCLIFMWAWGIADGALFAAYSLAAASAYLGIELRLVNGIPFGRQVDPSRGAYMLPLMIVGSLAMAAAVGVQYFLIFRSRMAVALVTIALAAPVYYLTRSSLRAFEVVIRYRLGLVSLESKLLYKEVET
jgi:hypothetical protein